MSRLVVVFILAFLVCSDENAFAHKGHRHDHVAPASPAIKENDSGDRQKMRDLYTRRVQPIFTKKCTDCHSDTTRYPWYYSIPGIKHYIDSDITEARKHMDMTNGYPFKSHATPIEDLDAIRETVEEGTMPPLRYRVLHPGSNLTPQERDIVLKWTDQTKALLKK